jgi:hypothetical protein
MINPSDYAKNPKAFSIKSIKDKDAKDDGSPTHIVSYKEYDRYSGEPTDKSEVVNQFQVGNQRKMLQDQIDRMTAELNGVDVFLTDCDKAKDTKA